MDKKYVSLNNVSNLIQNPYEIRTWKPPNYHKRNAFGEIKKCSALKSTSMKNAGGFGFRKDLLDNAGLRGEVKRKCNASSTLEECVHVRQLPKKLKYHSIARENIIRLQEDMQERGVRFQDRKDQKNQFDLIKFQSLANIGQVKQSSPSPSLEIMYSPSKRLLELKRPKSGIYINPTPSEDPDYTHKDFNPRELQVRLEQQNYVYDVIQTNGKHYVKVFNEFSATGGFTQVLPMNFPCAKDTVANADDNFLDLDSDVESDSFVQQAKSSFEEQAESDLKSSNKGIEIVLFAEFKCPTNLPKQTLHCPLQIAILIVAYAYNFYRPIHTWNMSNLQQIEQIGKKIHESSLKKASQNRDSDFDIDTQFFIGNIPIEVNFGKPIHSGNLWEEQFNVAMALANFFREKFACIFVCQNVSLLILKQCKTYYVFDANGRNRTSLKPDDQQGYAVLLTCKKLKSVANLILRGSQLKPEAVFRIYEISIASYGTADLSGKAVDDHKTERNYQIINKYFATIPGNTTFHITRQKSNPSMLIAGFARIYSDIHPARFWTGDMLDQLWKYALAAFSKQCKAQRLKSFTISNLPKVHRLGSYRAEVRTEPFLLTGQLSGCNNFRESQLSAAMCALFNKYESALIEIGYITLSVWKDSAFFYMFSPYSNYIAQTDGDSKNKSIPVLQMHLNKRSLCKELHSIATSIEPVVNFFIHGLEIFKLRAANHSRLKSEKTAYPLLFLDYPVQCNALSQETSELKQEHVKPSETDMAFERCLSVLSVSPCQRTCSESDISIEAPEEKLKVTQVQNTAFAATKADSAAADERNWYDAHDVVDYVLESLLEQTFGGKGSPLKGQSVKKARKVLIRSDKSELENLIGKVRRDEDLEDYYDEFQNVSNGSEAMISSTGELMTENYFQLMPDGDWIVCNSEYFEAANLGESFEPISAFVATIIANKYNVKSWNSKLLDYIAKSAQSLEKSREISKNFTKLLLSSKVPDIEIDDAVFRISVEKTAVGPAEQLHQLLDNVLKTNRNIVVALDSLSCAVFKRNNFYFLYLGFPCSVMGFRSNTCGLSCLIRSSDLSSIVRRIQANQKNCIRNERGMIFSLHITDISKGDRRILPRSPSDEEFLLAQEKDKLQKANERKQKKILYLMGELDKENRRIDSFKKQKGSGRERFQENDFGDEEEGEEEEGEEEQEQEDGEEDVFPEYDRQLTKKQRRRDDANAPADPLCAYTREIAYKTPVIGYQYTTPDFHFKIQGTTALESRAVDAGIDSIRSCHFASLFAIMYAVHRPLAKWDFRRVDRAIENGTNLFRKTKETMALFSRKIMDVIIDDTQYTLEVKKYDPLQNADSTPLNQAIQRLSKSRKYFLVQLENQTFAVYVDKYFHLFDPYRSMETVTEPGDEAKATRLKSMNPVQDRNTASWIVFPSVDDMLAYIKHRTTSSNIFSLYVVNVLAMKKAPRKERMANELQSTITAYDVAEKSDERLVELQSEKVSWIETFGGAVPWSPMCAVNLNGEQRGQLNTMWKHYSVEIEGKLYTLWGHIHPNSIAFGSNRGKQYHAVNILACCMAQVYPVEEWTPDVVNSIVVYGDEYFRKSASSIVAKNYEIDLEDFDTEFLMGKRCNFGIYLESVVYGLLYETNSKSFNLSKALSFFFLNNRYGIIQCMRKSFAFGKTKTGYFLFDCQSQGEPLFAANEGSAYVVFAKTLDVLLFCMIMTLRVPYYNIEFVLYAVAPTLKNTPELDTEADGQNKTAQAGEAEPEGE